MKNIPDLVRYLAIPAVIVCLGVIEWTIDYLFRKKCTVSVEATVVDYVRNVDSENPQAATYTPVVQFEYQGNLERRALIDVDEANAIETYPLQSKMTVYINPKKLHRVCISRRWLPH